MHTDSDRAKLLEDVNRKAYAANQAAIEWAETALKRIRELVPVWEAALAEANAETQNQIDELNRQIDELKQDVISDNHLRVWLQRAKVPNSRQHLAFSQTPRPEPVEPQTLGPYGQVAKRAAMAARGIQQ